jgi:tetraacyldisaccharide 4'-kinase
MRDYLYNLATDKAKGAISALIKIPLFALSLVYGLIVRILIFLYIRNQKQLESKVVGVGNITLGGTGKTSLVEFIAKALKKNGHRVAVLSRGYKRTRDTLMGDEPTMLAVKLKDVPVIVDADRFRGAKKAIKDYHADTLVLDDAFQQWRVKKDLEIVAIDSTKPFGNGRMIPRGILREPLSSLRRADIFILTKTNLIADTKGIRERLSVINPETPIVETVHKPVGLCELRNPARIFSPEFFDGKEVALFSGIGDPDSFAGVVRSMGLNVRLNLKFPDHFNYRQEDFDKIVNQAKVRNLNVIITTEKDAVRLTNIRIPGEGLQFLVLRIEIAVTKNEEALLSRLNSL